MVATIGPTTSGLVADLSLKLGHYIEAGQSLLALLLVQCSAVQFFVLCGGIETTKRFPRPSLLPYSAPQANRRARADFHLN